MGLGLTLNEALLVELWYYMVHYTYFTLLQHSYNVTMVRLTFGHGISFLPI